LSNLTNFRDICPILGDPKENLSDLQNLVPRQKKRKEKKNCQTDDGKKIDISVAGSSEIKRKEILYLLLQVQRETHYRGNE